MEGAEYIGVVDGVVEYSGGGGREEKEGGEGW